MKSFRGGKFWKNFSPRGDITPAQGWVGVGWVTKRIEGSIIKGGTFIQDFFVKNHATYSCKNSVLQGILVQFNPIELALLIRQKHFKNLYNLCFNISVHSLRLPDYSNPPLFEPLELVSLVISVELADTTEWLT